MISERKRKVLLVDDNLPNIKLMQRILSTEGYELYDAANGKEAVKIVEKILPDIILMDVMMPEMDGFEATRIIRSNEKTKFIPIVVVTALTEPEYTAKALEIGADDFIRKPFDVLEVRARVKSLLKVKDYNDYMINYQKKLKEEVDKRTSEVKEFYKKFKAASLETIYLLSRAAEYKDQETGIHIKRMSNYAAMIAEKIGMSNEKVESILYASSMHDVGKIGIPDKILMKPAKLDANEWNVMKMHTTIGAQILESGENDLIKLGKEIALSHHEKWDGSGYPCGLKGKEIPIIGRICAVADVFDALTSRRPYKEAYSFEKSIKIMQDEAEKSFDPDILTAFISIQDKVIKVMDYFKDVDESLFLQMMSKANLV